MERPQRRFQVTIELGADDDKELATALRQVCEDIIGGQRGSVSGGPSSGWVYKVIERTDMTHDRYIEELNRYINNGSNVDCEG